MAKVTVPPTGNVGMITPVDSSSATVTFAGAGHAAPPVAPRHTAAVLLRPAAIGSVTIEPLPDDGPALETTTVYVVVPLALTVVTPSVLVIDRSASGCTLSVSLAVLLPGVGSLVPAGGATVTVLVTVPLVAVTFAEMAKVTVPPTGNVGMITPVDSSSATVTFAGAGHTAPPVAPMHAAPVLLNPAATGSLTTEPSPGEGPALVTTTVYVVLPPALTVVTPSFFEIPRSASGCTLSVSLA